MKNLFLLWSFVFMFIKIQGESANDRLLDGRIMGKKNQTNSATRFDDFHVRNIFKTLFRHFSVKFIV